MTHLDKCTHCPRLPQARISRLGDPSFLHPKVLQLPRRECLAWVNIIKPNWFNSLRRQKKGGGGNNFQEL